MSIRELLNELASLRKKLSEHGIRDESGYAEMLVAEALKGVRHSSGVQKGSDLLAPEFGRVEVRSRTLPLDGRHEARLNLPAKKRGEFDWFAGIVFNSDLSINHAFLLPHDEAWVCASQNKRNDITHKNAKSCNGFLPLPNLDQAEAALNA
jgi:hypothetical protein